MKKKKIIKAQLGKIIKDNLSPQQKMQLESYKKTVVDERSNKENERMDQEQKDSYMKRISEYQAQPKYRSERGPYAEDAMEAPRRKRMPSLQMEELSRVSEPATPEAAAEALDQLYKQSLNEMMQQGAQGAAGEATGRKKGGMTKAQKKVGTVMSEFKKGKLKSSSDKKVTNPKQAIAIGLSEAGMSNKKMMNKGGMVRGQGIAIRGTKFKGIF
jgi:hypothetical protein